MELVFNPQIHPEHPLDDIGIGDSLPLGSGGTSFYLALMKVAHLPDQPSPGMSRIGSGPGRSIQYAPDCSSS
jgi:hypothetical protein